MADFLFFIMLIQQTVDSSRRSRSYLSRRLPGPVLQRELTPTTPTLEVGKDVKKVVPMKRMSVTLGVGLFVPAFLLNHVVPTWSEIPVPTAALPPGGYKLFLGVTPDGAVDAMCLWEADFQIVQTQAPSESLTLPFKWRPAR